MKKPQTAKLFIEGWTFYYNCLRPHESLNDKTPSQEAGIDVPFKNWIDVVSRKSKTKPVMKIPKISIKNLISPTPKTRKPESAMHYTPRKSRKKEKDVTYMALDLKGKTTLISRNPIRGVKKVIKRKGRIIR